MIAADEKHSAPETERSGRVSYKILCVEDNEDMLFLLRDRLQWEGYGVVEAMTMKEGRERLAHNGFHLLLLDLMLPDGDGLDLLSEVRASERWKGLPVIVLSGRGDDQTISEGLRRGADRYLVKETSFEALVRSLKEILRGG